MKLPQYPGLTKDVVESAEYRRADVLDLVRELFALSTGKYLPLDSQSQYACKLGRYPARNP